MKIYNFDGLEDDFCINISIRVINHKSLKRQNDLSLLCFQIKCICFFISGKIKAKRKTKQA